MGQRPKLLNFNDLSEGRKFIFDNPIGYRKSGKPILLIAGGSGEDDEDEDVDKINNVGADSNTVAYALFYKARERMRAADRRSADLQTRLTAAEAEAAKVKDLEQKISDSDLAVKKLRIDNAFLASSDIAWQDPEVALRLVDLSKVTIDDNGEVKGLADALKELAEKKPFLVKAEEDKGKKKGKKDAEGDDEDDDDEDVDDDDDADDQDDQDDATSGGDSTGKNGQQGGGVSGTSTGSGRRKRKTKGPTDAELMARYRI